MHKIIFVLILLTGTTVAWSNSGTIVLSTADQKYASAYSENSFTNSNNIINANNGNNGNNANIGNIGNNGNNDRDDGYCTPVPEPSTTVALMGGVAGAFVFFRKKMLWKKSKN